MIKSRFFRITTGILLVLLLTAAIAVTAALQNPIISFVTKQSGYLNPGGYTKTEETLQIDNTSSTQVIVYRNNSRKTDLYYILVHGFAPRAHRHEKIDRMAASLCDATGMNVLVPLIPSFFSIHATPPLVSAELAKIYTAANIQYPGRYRAFAACLGSTVLLTGLKEVEKKYLPEKIFLYGSLYDGSILLDKMEKSGTEIDFIVKLVMAVTSGRYKDNERQLIQKALMATEPGPTDVSKMKRILGEKLYGNMAVFNFTEKDIKGLDPDISSTVEKYSHSKFFILNPRSDRIIPFGEGKKLAKVLQKKGAEVNFLGTKLFGHTENRTTTDGVIEEFKYMYSFFKELFEGDLE